MESTETVAAPEAGELQVHRTILQGMAVHLQKLQAEVFDLQQTTAGIIDWIEGLQQEAPEPEAPAAPEVPSEG